MYMSIDTENTSTKKKGKSNKRSATGELNKVVVVKQDLDPAIVNVNRNLEYIKNVSNNITSIVSVDNIKDVLPKVLSMQEAISKVLAKSDSIDMLSSISKELNILAVNIDVLKTIIEDIEVFNTINNKIDAIETLYNIREAIVTLSEIRNNLVELHEALPEIKVLVDNLDNVLVVHEFLLPINILAQNIELLAFFKEHITVFEGIVSIKDTLTKFITEIDIAKELINVVNNLPQVLQKLKEDIASLGTNLTQDIKDKVQEQLDTLDKRMFDFEKLKLQITTQQMELGIAIAKLEGRVTSLEKDNNHHCCCCGADASPKPQNNYRVKTTIVTPDMCSITDTSNHEYGDYKVTLVSSIPNTISVLVIGSNNEEVLSQKLYTSNGEFDSVYLDVNKGFKLIVKSIEKIQGE